MSPFLQGPSLNLSIEVACFLQPLHWCIVRRLPCVTQQTLLRSSSACLFPWSSCSSGPATVQVLWQALRLAAANVHRAVYVLTSGLLHVSTVMQIAGVVAAEHLHCLTDPNSCC